ncbi:MAG: phage holin family protein [Bradymonadaceae bacterium]
MSILISWLILSFAFWLTSVVLPGFTIRGAGNALVVAALFGVLHFFLGWLFMAVFTIATLGVAYLLAFITRWIITAIILKITDAFTDRLDIKGFGTALIAALLVSAIGTGAQWLLSAAGVI